MGRREKPLDPDEGPVQRFAYDLRELRREAGTPTYRTMAEGSRYSAPTLSAAAAGARLPSLAVALAYATACGGDPAEWEKRWREASAGEPVLARDDGTSAPYPGLARYGTEDRDHFFGRDALVADLLELTRRRPFAALVGASGSGKSSLLRAGLVPALREGGGSSGTASVDRTPGDGTGGPSVSRTPGDTGTASVDRTPGDTGGPSVIRILTPGPTPARTHRALFTEGALVLVDQFEEVFTLCRDPAERAAFIKLLTGSGARPGAGSGAGPGARVLIAVRADFYGRCAEHPALADALKDSVLLVGPMTPEQLREAVVGPATAERLIVERALTARIVADVADEPGGLPLMSHALLETWRRRHGRTLTVSAYEAIGGVRGAIAHTAEEIFTSLTDEQSRAARALLLRLISPGEGGQDTRRPAERTELLQSPESERVLERLVRARLLTVDDTSVDLAHEALITGWPRLRGWIEDDRDLLRSHRRLTDAARMWEELGRDPGALYRGAQLVGAREAFLAEAPGAQAHDSARDLPKAPDPPGTRRLFRRAPPRGPGETPRTPADWLTPQERDFLTASLAAYDCELRAAARTTRRLRVLTITLSVLLCLAAIAGLTAWQQSEVSDRRATEAEARRAAGVADALRTSDPRTAMRLSLAAWELADLPETRESLFAAGAQHTVDMFAAPLPESETEEDTSWWRFSDDGRTVAVVGPDRVDRWDVATHRRVATLPGLGRQAHGILDVSPDIRRAAFTSPDGIRIWDLAIGRPTGKAFGPRGDDSEGWFGPQGRLFGAHRSNGPLQLWDTRTGRPLLDTGGRYREIRRFQISSDDRLLAFCPSSAGEGPLQIWDLRERRRLHTPWATRVDLCHLTDDIQFTPDNRALAINAETGVRTWDIRSGRERPRITTGGMSSVAFSADGTHAATLTADEIRLWRLSDHLPPVALSRYPAVNRNLSDLRLDMRAGIIRFTEFLAPPARNVWTIAFDPMNPAAGERAPFTAAAYSPDGTVLATQRTPADGARTHELRDAADGRSFAALPGPGPGPGRPSACGSRCPGMAFSPDSRAFAYLNASGAVAVRDIRSGAVASVPPPPHHDGEVAVGDVSDGDGDGDGDNGRPLAVSRSAMKAKSIDSLRLGQDGSVRGLGPAGGIQGLGSVQGRGWSTLRPGANGPLLATAPDGRFFAQYRQLIDPETGEATRIMRGESYASSAVFSPDGRFSAMSDWTGRTTLWDGEGKRLLALLVPAVPNASHAQEGRLGRALAFSADGRKVAVGDADGGVRIWDTASPRSQGSPLPPADGPVLALAFGEDGGELRVTTPYVALRTHALDPGRTAENVCRRALGELSRTEWKTYLPTVPYRPTCPP
ncbi:nSTAND1 domain-containing NTPase [Streptomyces sp. NPDC055078]